MSLCASVYMCFVVTCWERADLLALVCGVYYEFVTFPLVSWVRCGTWLYQFLIFAPLLTLKSAYFRKSCLKYPQRKFKMNCVETFRYCCNLDIVLMTLFSMVWLFVKWCHTYRHSVKFFSPPPPLLRGTTIWCKGFQMALIMLFKLYLNWCILSRTQQYLGLRCYVQFVIILQALTRNVKSRQIPNILTPGVIMKCKNGFLLTINQKNRRKKPIKNIELELYNHKYVGSLAKLTFFGLHLLCKKPECSWFHEQTLNQIYFLNYGMQLIVKPLEVYIFSKVT